MSPHAFSLKSSSAIVMPVFDQQTPLNLPRQLGRYCGPSGINVQGAAEDRKPVRPLRQPPEFDYSVLHIRFQIGM